MSHSGTWVAVALSDAGPVGVDVEQVADVDVDSLARHVLHADETAARLPEFFVYWTRKEAVVKATGDGLAAELARVRVSAPHEPPALLAYPGRPGLAAHLVDLARDDGYAAALAVLTDHPVPVTEHSAADLL
jgi:4'-phosphopantetheinyl transferase